MINTLTTPSASNGCLNLYTFCSYGGFQQQICNNISDLRTIAWSDLASSIFLGRGVKATIFTGINYTGTSITLATSDSCLSKDNKMFDKNISSLKLSLSDYCVITYPQCGFVGTPTLICDNNQNLTDLSVASMQVGNQTLVSLYNGQNYTNASFASNEDVSCINSDAYSGVTNSIQISPMQGCVWLFPTCNFIGQPTVLCKSNPVVISEFSSIKVGVNANVTIYTSVLYKGNNQTITQDANCLTNDTVINSRFMSIKFN